LAGILSNIIIKTGVFKMRSAKVIRVNELPIRFWDLKCRECKTFKEGKAHFIEDWNEVLRIECENLGSLRVDEWHFKIKNCPFFSPNGLFLFEKLW